MSAGLLAAFLVAILPSTALAQPVPTDGLQLWLRADAVEATDGAAVDAWPDRSTHDRALSQSDRARQPTYVADAINGQPLLKFDENDRFDTSLLSTGSGYTIMRVTRQKDRGYLSVTEGTIGKNEAGSTLQRFLQGQVAEVLVYNRRLSKMEKQAVSNALGQRYGLSPGTTTARSDDANGTPSEDVRVHGAWSITVRNPDGSLDTRRTFENSFENPQALSNFLARDRTVGYWWIEAESGSNSENPCEMSDGTPIKCRITEASSTNSNWIFPGLDVSAPDSGDNANSVVVQGSFTAQKDGQVEFVSTHLGDCDPSTAPGNCNNTSSSPFTSKFFSSSPVSVTSGQQVNVSVVINFQ